MTMDLGKETKGLIHNVLNSSKQMLTIRKLNTEYRELVGESIPFLKLGFPTLELYLSSLHDILQICGQGDLAKIKVIVGDKSAHVRELISKQRDPKKPLGRGHQGRLCTYRQQNFTHNGVLLNQTHNRSNQRRSESKLQNGVFLGKSLGISHQMPYMLNLPAMSASYSNNWKPAFNKQNISCNNETQSRTNVDKNKNNFQTDSSHKQQQSSQVIVNNHNTIHSNKLNEDEFSDEEHVNLKIPQVIQNNIKQLISHYPGGIWCTDIPEAYRKKFGSDIDYVEYGYTSLSQMCMDMGNSLKHVQPKQGYYKFFFKNQPVPLPMERQISKPSNTSAIAADATLPEDVVQDLLMNIHKISLPSDIIISGEKIERQWISDGVKVLSYLDVNVGEIYDPSKFWINLCETGYQLNILMDAMQEFYQTNSKTYKIPYFGLKTGLYVATTYLNEYHRALIIDELNDYRDKIKVFFIDYGTVSVVNSSEVCYLSRQFVDLSAQGIRTRLAGICPADQVDGWPRPAAERFMSLIKDKDLVAQIININDEKKILDVILVDTSENDFFINDALVQEGFASFCQVNLCTTEGIDLDGSSSSSLESRVESSLKPREILQILRQRRK